MKSWKRKKTLTFGRAARASLAPLVAAVLLLTGGSPAAGHEPLPIPKQRETVRRRTNRAVPDFSLEDQNGNPFSFRNLRGKLVVVSFVYTSCPDVCPLITSSLRQVQKQLRPGERASIYFLSVTTDPEIDNPRILKAYGKRYGIDFANWSLLTGKPDSLRSVWEGFGVKARRKARGLINHTALTALVDEKGVMRFAYHGSFPEPKAILQDLRALISSR